MDQCTKTEFMKFAKIDIWLKRGQVMTEDASDQSGHCGKWFYPRLPKLLFWDAVGIYVQLIETTA